MCERSRQGSNLGPAARLLDGDPGHRRDWPEDATCVHSADVMLGEADYTSGMRNKKTALSE
ncbi:MAG: hypothetical protein O7F16_00975, partial [Acidobacteria bacterium]|nr:hypothetical protein [Acidobacteriota bacterium]